MSAGLPEFEKPDGWTDGHLEGVREWARNFPARADQGPQHVSIVALLAEIDAAVARAEAAESRLADVLTVVESWKSDKRFAERRSWQGMARSIERVACATGALQSVEELLEQSVGRVETSIIGARNVSGRVMEFESLHRFEVAGRGTVVVVAAPFDFTDRSQFHGGQIIDGQPVTVVGVESWAIPQIVKGTEIGLLLAP